MQGIAASMCWLASRLSNWLAAVGLHPADDQSIPDGGVGWSMRMTILIDERQDVETMFATAQRKLLLPWAKAGQLLGTLSWL